MRKRSVFVAAEPHAAGKLECLPIDLPDAGTVEKLITRSAPRIRPGGDDISVSVRILASLMPGRRCESIRTAQFHRSCRHWQPLPLQASTGKQVAEFHATTARFSVRASGRKGPAIASQRRG